ncbi:hypothetical protein B5X24_HaOG212026 [Helicoverpa armigera]|nr:hypothetical protein B5X24_HaOG212026 [Helicoverpa armigera]
MTVNRTTFISRTIEKKIFKHKQSSYAGSATRVSVEEVSVTQPQRNYLAEYCRLPDAGNTTIVTSTHSLGKSHMRPGA